MIIVNGYKPLTMITKSPILEVVSVLDLSLVFDDDDELLLRNGRQVKGPRSYFQLGP